jgi:hypothetical protein
MMKKIIDELINNSIEGVDVYRYNDATWLIFTDENRWVVEMTDGGTLWYNYKFFNDIMRYVSMDPKEYEGYITEWANDYFFKEIKKSQMGIPIDGEFAVDIVINDGVKKMGDSNSIRIQNRGQNLTWRIVKDAKPNVVFHGINNSSMSFVTCNGNSTHIHKIVEEGIKNTMPSKATSKRGIHYDDLMCSGNRTDISLIVEGGIKNTWPDKIPHDYDWSDEFDVNKVVDGGVKV